MSGPFIYTPSSSSYDYGFASNPYHSQFMNRQRISPHIPAVNLSDLSAPNTPIRGPKILHEDPWAPTYSRSRRPSWHAGMSTPFLDTSTSTLAIPAGNAHSRRRSMDNRNQRPDFSDYFQRQQASPYPWMVPGTPVPSNTGNPYSYSGYPPFVPSELHPLLRLDSRDIKLDLSYFEFRPLDAHGRSIPFHTLAEPATFPTTTRLVIKSDRVPQWPVLLDYHAATFNTPHSPSSLPPITLGDVLFAIHQTMQTQITHREWAELDDREESEVGKAYVRRYKLVPGHESRLAADGVKRVDYLLKKVMFAGLTRKTGDQGYENLKLHVENK
jgi:hypothetical protein